MNARVERQRGARRLVRSDALDRRCARIAAVAAHRAATRSEQRDGACSDLRGERRSWSTRAPAAAARDQRHRALDRNARDAVRAIDPAVAFEQLRASRRERAMPARRDRASARRRRRWRRACRVRRDADGRASVREVQRGDGGARARIGDRGRRSTARRPAMPRRLSCSGMQRDRRASLRGSAMAPRADAQSARRGAVAAAIAIMAASHRPPCATSAAKSSQCSSKPACRSDGTAATGMSSHCPASTISADDAERAAAALEAAEQHRARTAARNPARARPSASQRQPSTCAASTTRSRAAGPPPRR